MNEEGRERLDRYLDLRSDSPLAAPGGVRLLGVHDVRQRPLASAASQDGEGGSYPLHLTAEAILFGPWMPTNRTASPCSHCLALRWQKLRSEPERQALETSHGMLSLADSPYLTPFAFEAARQLLATLTEEDGKRAGAVLPPGAALVYELSLHTLRVHSFPLMADPACAACSRPEADTPEGAYPHLTSRAKPAVSEYRMRSVDDNGLVLDAFANPVCGMLGRSARPDLSCPTTAPVNGSIRVRLADHLFEVNWGGHSNSYDGSSLLGVFEGLERYAGGQRRRFNDPVVDSYRNLASQALDPRDCGVYTDEFYSTDELYTKFSADRPIPWVWGYSLRDERPILVPEISAYYIGLVGREETFVHECSNGCAGGSCLEEAILHGMLELLERDAFLLGWYGKASLPEIDPETCTDRATQFMIDRVRLHGYDVRLFDNRVDLPVPVVTGVAIRRDGGPGALCFASGASLDPDDAVRSALCEIASYIPYLPDRTRDRWEELEAMSTDYSKVTRLNDHAGLLWLPEMSHHADFLLTDKPKSPMADLYHAWQHERPQTPDLLDDVHYCRDVLAAAGFDVIVVDQTCPEQELVGLRTARVIAPGLIPIDFGWRMQRALHMPRLRTAFRHAGWREKDMDDAELNYVPHPFP